MRISAYLFSLLLFGLSATPDLAAQSPDAQQDAEAAREKLLKASDELDNIQANSEATKTAVDGMKASVVKLQDDVAKLQSDNAALRQQLADLQAAFDKSEAAHAKERQVLLDSVAGMIASGKGSGSSKPPKKKTKDAATTPDAAGLTPEKTPETNASPTAPPPDTSATSTPPTPDAAPAKPQKGYYHIVASGETLTLICNAYRQAGVNISVTEIQKANGLTDKSVLKVGQKLFIPKPGT